MTHHHEPDEADPSAIVREIDATLKRIDAGLVCERAATGALFVRLGIEGRE